MATRLSDFAASVHTRLAGLGLSYEQRDDVASLQVHDKLVRLVWKTPGGTIEPPRQAGGRRPTDGSASRVQACAIRQEEVHVHIFGETRELAEQILDAVIAAIHSEGPVLEMRDYRWKTEERAEHGHVQRAHECILVFFLRLPVAEEVAPLVTVSDQSHTCEYTSE